MGANPASWPITVFLSIYSCTSYFIFGSTDRVSSTGSLRQSGKFMIRREILDDVYTRVRHVTNDDHCRRWLGLDELLDVIEIAPSDGIKGVPPALADFFREIPLTGSLHSAEFAFSSHQRLYGEFRARIQWQDYQASGNSN
jgi:hypothetical protein